MEGLRQGRVSAPQSPHTLWHIGLSQILVLLTVTDKEYSDRQRLLCLGGDAEVAPEGVPCAARERRAEGDVEVDQHNRRGDEELPRLQAAEKLVSTTRLALAKNMGKSRGGAGSGGHLPWTWLRVGTPRQRPPRCWLQTWRRTDPSARHLRQRGIDWVSGVWGPRHLRWRRWRWVQNLPPAARETNMSTYTIEQAVLSVF